jgi:hypothetical protein
MSQAKIAIASFLISISVYTLNWLLFQIYASKCMKWGFSGYFEGITGVSNPHCQYLFSFLNKSLDLYISMSVAASVSFVATIVVCSQKLFEYLFSSEIISQLNLGNSLPTSNLNQPFSFNNVYNNLNNTNTINTKNNIPKSNIDNSINPNLDENINLENSNSDDNIENNENNSEIIIENNNELINLDG